MRRVPSHASLVQELCQAWDDAVQHILLGLQNTIRSAPPPYQPFFFGGDLREKHWHCSDLTLNSA